MTQSQQTGYPTCSSTAILQNSLKAEKMTKTNSFIRSCITFIVHQKEEGVLPYRSLNNKRM